ncbi:MAG: hypothetical protein ACI3W8_02435 [Oscillospiraceae bacterium]
MKKIIALALTAALVLAMTACGSKDFDRSANGYLTEDAAKAVAAQSVGYKADEVDFTESVFEGDEAGGDESAVYRFVFTDSVAEYTCEISAMQGTVVSSSAK